MDAPSPQSLEQWSALCGALGHPTRLRIVLLLARGGGVAEARPSHLCVILGVAQPVVSAHLAYLLANGLVTVRRKGRTRFYKLDPRVVVKGRSLTVSGSGLVLRIGG